MNWNRTLELIPDGVQTLSKMPSKHINGVYPKYITHGSGAYVWGEDGKKYIDFPCGLGAILLGHNHPATFRAVVDQVAKGILFSLPNYLETELAERIVELIPCAEQVRFLKTGSEACTAAVRIARAYTGKKMVLCCGYHGWHDFYAVNTPKNNGIIQNQHTRKLEYNDIKKFEEMFQKHQVAAVIMEPYILDKPKGEFLKKIRKLCTVNNAVLIFDEVITAFRTEDWTAQKMFGITPDLTTFGKALGNGLPMGGVCGKKELMEVLTKDCFVSSTFGGELVSIASALATIKAIEDDGVIPRIWRTGEQITSAFNRLARGLEGTKCIGYPPRTFFVFPTEAHKGLFWQECLSRGVLFGYAQFISGAMGQQELDVTLVAIQESLRILKKYWEDPIKGLRGELPQETFRLVNT